MLCTENDDMGAWSRPNGSIGVIPMDDDYFLNLSARHGVTERTAYSTRRNVSALLYSSAEAYSQLLYVIAYGA